MNSALSLAVGQYRFEFIAADKLLLPAYTGSSWRGIFGHSLKRSVCVTREKHCPKCLLWRNCAYSYLFETPPAVDAKMMKKYSAVPHPYIIQPNPTQSREIEKGETIWIDIHLIGKANQQLPYFVHAFQQAGQRGIGAQRGKFSLEKISQIQAHQSNEIFNSKQNILNNIEVKPIVTASLPEQNITLQFITPYRIRSQNRYITPEQFSFYHLISPLLRRISSLHYFHAEQELPLDYAQLSQQAKTISPVQQQLNWQEWTRYSSRQQSKIRMGGLVGSIELAPTEIREFWPLLYLGQYINVGKGTVMGLGKYTLK